MEVCLIWPLQAVGWIKLSVGNKNRNVCNKWGSVRWNSLKVILIQMWFSLILRCVLLADEAGFILTRRSVQMLMTYMFCLRCAAEFAPRCESVFKHFNWISVKAPLHIEESPPWQGTLIYLTCCFDDSLLSCPCIWFITGDCLWQKIHFPLFYINMSWSV